MERFRVVRLEICGDNCAARNPQFTRNFPGLGITSTFQFIFHHLQVLVEHLEEQNIDGFTDAVKDYDSISRLDQWYTTMLLRIKKQHNDNPDLR